MQTAKQITEKTGIRQLYSKRVKHYDLSANLYCLIGVREYAYRKRAVKMLDLHRGTTVVELGCGTGLNFAYLQEKIGPYGKIIGVDLTDEMLHVAEARCHDNGWANVVLARHDAASFTFQSMLMGLFRLLR